MCPRCDKRSTALVRLYMTFICYVSKHFFRSLRVRVRPVDAVNNALLSNYCPTGEVSSEEKNDKLFHKNRLSNASPLHTQHYALQF